MDCIFIISAICDTYSFHSLRWDLKIFQLRGQRVSYQAGKGKIFPWHKYDIWKAMRKGIGRCWALSRAPHPPRGRLSSTKSSQLTWSCNNSVRDFFLSIQLSEVKINIHWIFIKYLSNIYTVNIRFNCKYFSLYHKTMSWGWAPFPLLSEGTPHLKLETVNI